MSIMMKMKKNMNMKVSVTNLIMNLDKVVVVALVIQVMQVMWVVLVIAAIIIETSMLRNDLVI